MALWLVATPIGTLGDLSARAREVLTSASVIAAEDTRTTRKLLSAVDVPAPELVALHAHNEAAIAEVIARRAVDSEVVLVSDAGTPAISDPGSAVVAAAHRLGVEIRSVPGPSALSASLAAAGFGAAPSSFVGFPPRKGRDGWVEAILTRPEVVVIYEAPSRVADLLRRLAALSPEREACLCRELSKRYEEVRRAPLPALAAELTARETVRGECVVVLGPGQGRRIEVANAELDEGAGLKDIAAALSNRWQVPRRDIYQRLLGWEREIGDED